MALIRLGGCWFCHEVAHIGAISENLRLLLACLSWLHNSEGKFSRIGVWFILFVCFVV